MSVRLWDSPRFIARLAGLLYVVVIAAGSFSLSARTGTVVHGDAAATARNLLAAEPMYRLGIAADLIANAAYVGVAALLYQLLRPVSRSLSLLAAFFCLVALAVSAGNLVNAIAPLTLLGGGNDLAGLGPQQLQAMAFAAIKLQGQGYNIATMFFGFYCFSIGCLVMGARFMPRLVGALMALAGLSWLSDSFATLLAPVGAAHLAPIFLATAALGEVSLTLWLVLAGVNADRWRAQAAAARS